MPLLSAIFSADIEGGTWKIFTPNPSHPVIITFEQVCCSFLFVLVDGITGIWNITFEAACYTVSITFMRNAAKPLGEVSSPCAPLSALLLMAGCCDCIT